MKRIFWIVVILVFLQACAQPPQALPAVPTNISTQAVALATDTPPPTDTATPLPTSTSTPTATFTPTKTATPTLTPVPTSAILYFEDFEDNKANHWNASLGKWTIELEDENHYWKGTGPKAYPQAGMSYNTSKWTDYAFESRIRMVSGTIFILARWNRGNFYAATLNPASDWVDFAEWDRKNYTAFGGNSFPLSYNQWMVVRFEVQGDTLRLYINEQLAALATRTSNAAGGIGYYMGGGEEVHFDDIRVWQLSAP